MSVPDVTAPSQLLIRSYMASQMLCTATRRIRTKPCSFTGSIQKDRVLSEQETETSTCEIQPAFFPDSTGLLGPDPRMRCNLSSTWAALQDCPQACHLESLNLPLPISPPSARCCAATVSAPHAPTPALGSQLVPAGRACLWPLPHRAEALATWGLARWATPLSHLPQPQLAPS